MKFPLLSLALLSAVVTSVEAADEPYWLHKEDHKCPFDNTRIFKYFGKDVEECYKECFDTPNCHHFSVGFYAGKINCMGCNGHESGVQSHNGFTTYAITEREWQYTLVGRAKECPAANSLNTLSGVSRDTCWVSCKNTAGCGFFTFADLAKDVDGNGSCKLCNIGDGLSKKTNSNTYSILAPADYKPVCAGPAGTVWGDPHIITFDGQRYDCQGRGEFVLAMSKGDDPLKIHGRFVDTAGSVSSPSVARSVALKVDENVPVVHVSIPDMPDADGKCPYSYSIGDDETPIPAEDVVTYFLENYAGQLNVYTNVHSVILTFPDYQSRIEIITHSGLFERYGCRMRANVCLTPEHHGGAENIVGLLGSPNGDKTDDWMESSPEGATLPIPSDSWAARIGGHRYCMANWCVGAAEGSLYTGDTFDTYNKCPEDSFDPDAFQAIIDALDPVVVATCEGKSTNPEECAIDIALEVEGTDKDPLELIEKITQEEEEAKIISETTEAELYGEEDWNSPNVTTLVALGTASSNLEVGDEDPTSSPTSGPTSSPTNGPTSAAPEATDSSPPVTPATSGSQGDPHFKTWKNEHYEYHGQCDMVLAKDLEFASGLGLDVQIRTKLVRYWSYIASAAVRIGDDILEIRGSADIDNAEPVYWINFQYRGNVETVGGFPLTIGTGTGSNHKHNFVIDLSSRYPGQSITMSVWKEFVKVTFINASEESFGKTIGMLGEFTSGKTLARDGSTLLDDFTELGNEWQVLPSEDMLFHDLSEPQFPKKCIEPEDPQGARRRRLGENTVSEEDAEVTCASLQDAADRKDCVYDILATQDLDMVGAY